MFLAYISQYLLPHSMDSSNFFVLSSYYSIHSFYLSRYFLPCSGMSQEVNFAFSDIFTPFTHITSRAARRTRNDGYNGRLLRVNPRPVWTLNLACDGHISTAVTRRHPSQNGRYARFTGTGKVQNHFCIPLSIYVTHIMRLGLVRHMAS